jgi:hypothetical protein
VRVNEGGTPSKGVPTQADRERPPKKRKRKQPPRGRTVRTEAPARPNPLETRASMAGGSAPEFMRSRPGRATLPQLHGGDGDPRAQAALRREFGVFEHPLPENPLLRNRMVGLEQAYKARTGRNLRQERDMRGALRSAGILSVGALGASAPPTLDQGRAPDPYMGPMTAPKVWLGTRTFKDPLAGISGTGKADIDGGLLDSAKGVAKAAAFSPIMAPATLTGLALNRGAAEAGKQSLKLQGKVSEIGGLRPKITVPRELWDDLGITEAYASGQGLSDEEKRELVDRFGEFGLFQPEQRKALIEQAQANGWSDRDVRTLTDTELIEKAFGPKTSYARAAVTNLGREVAGLGAAPMGVIALGESAIDSAQEGSIDPLARTVQEGFVDPTIRAVTDPVDSFRDAPLTTATTLWGAAKLAGAAARFAPGGARLLPGGARNVQLGERFANPQTGEALNVGLGLKSRNAAVRPFQALEEAALGRSDLLAGRRLGRIATRGAGQAEHLGRLAGAKRTQPLADAVKGLSDKEKQAAYFWGIQSRNPTNTIAVFEDKLKRALKSNPEASPTVKAYRAQIEMARQAEKTLDELPPDRIAAIRQAAEQIEGANQDDLVRLGMDPATLEARLWDVAAREDLTSIFGERPAMHFPHTPATATGGKLRRGRPMVTGEGGERDLLGGRLQERNMQTYERGRLLQDPDLFEQAAGNPARFHTLAQEMQRRVADKVGHRVDLTDETAQHFDWDDNDWVVVQTGDKRFGATRLDPEVRAKRQADLGDLMERTELGDTLAARDLFRRSFDVIERDQTTGPPTLGPGTYYAIPRQVWDDLEARATDAAKQGGGLGKLTRAWRTITLNTLPRTVVNNTVGSMPLAAAGGAGPLSYFRSARALRAAGKGADDLIPGELRGVGLAGAGTKGVDLGDTLAGRAAAGWMNTMRKGNVFGEDAARGAIWMRNARPAAKKAAKELNESADDVLKRWANDPESRTPEVEGFIQKSIDFAGDLTPGKHDAGLSLVVPFHRWYRHIAKLTLATMPVKHPGRAAFLYNLGQVGDEYRKQHGVWPSWMNDLIPIRTKYEGVPGYDEQGNATTIPTEITQGIRTGSANPFKTVTDTFGTDQALGTISPILATPAEFVANQKIGGPMSGSKFQNEHGEDIDSRLSGDWVKVGARQFVASIPLAQWAAGFFGSYSGDADTSILPDMEPRRYAKPGGGFLPDPYKPTESSMGGFLPTITRGLGLPIGQTDARGPRSVQQLKWDLTFAQRDRTARQNRRNEQRG